MSGTMTLTERGHALVVRRFGVVGYRAAWRAMRSLTDARGSDAADELWTLQHPSVFTLGQAGRYEHVLSPGDIAVIESDRGGQVTYHGPGQTVFYILYDLKRARIGVKRLVGSIEEAIIELLSSAALEASRLSGAPGVYVNGKKIGALGLRVRNGRSYHGLALNVDLDLEPFRRIEPCGMPGLEATSLRQLGIDWTVEQTESRLIPILASKLGFSADTVIERVGDLCALAPVRCGPAMLNDLRPDSAPTR